MSDKYVQWCMSLPITKSIVLPLWKTTKRSLTVRCGSKSKTWDVPLTQPRWTLHIPESGAEVMVHHDTDHGPKDYKFHVMPLNPVRSKKKAREAGFSLHGLPSPVDECPAWMVEEEVVEVKEVKTSSKSRRRSKKSDPVEEVKDIEVKGDDE